MRVPGISSSIFGSGKRDAAVGIAEPTDPSRKDFAAFETILVGNVRIAIDRAAIAEPILLAMLSGRYEQRERKLIEHAVQPGDRVVELGGGIGVTAIVAARIVGNGAIRSYEANPELIDWARHNASLNGVAPEFVHGTLLSRSQINDLGRPTVPFLVSGHFWASSIAKRANGKTIDVPYHPIGPTLKEFRANTLVLDIEGGEVPLLMNADLSPIKKIILELHYKQAGAQQTDDLIRALHARGFAVDLDHSGAGVAFLRR